MTSPLPLPSPAFVETPARASSAPSSIIFFGILSILLIGPLAFGAVEPWSIFLFEIATALLFAAWTIQHTLSATSHVEWSPLFAPMLGFAFLIALQVVSGKTAYRYATLTEGLLYVAYGILCFLVVQTVRRTSQIKFMATAFSIFGVVVALFGMLQSLSSNGKLYWLRTPRSGGWIYGPYVNHNHFAGLMEMLLPIPLVFALSRHARGKRRIIAALAAAIMASSIFLSGSRGGMIAFIGEMIFLVIILTVQRKRPRASFAGWSTFGIFAILSVGLLVWIGSGELAKRIATVPSMKQADLSETMRLQIYRDIFKMIPGHPVLGWGLGTFGDVYPQFRSFYTVFFVDEAHNDYLQLLVEMGGIGFAIMLWFLAIVFRRSTKKLRNWPTDTNSAVTLAALLGIVGLLVHSFVDFNLQVPANAALFYVLCTIAAMEPRFGLFRAHKLQPLNPSI